MELLSSVEAQPTACIKCLIKIPLMFLAKQRWQRLELRPMNRHRYRKCTNAGADKHSVIHAIGLLMLRYGPAFL